MSPGKRGSLAGLQPAPAAVPPLPVRPAALPAEVQTPVQQSPEVRSPEVQTPAAAEPRARRRPRGQPAARIPAPVPGLPKYLRLERKELLIWPDQVTNLSILARVLNRTRGGAGERITTNTLIRVAASLLLSRSQDLAGTTEEELRRSLGLPDLQTPYLRSLGELPDGGDSCDRSNRHRSAAILAPAASGCSDMAAYPTNVVDRHRAEVEAEARSAAGE